MLCETDHLELFTQCSLTCLAMKYGVRDDDRTNDKSRIPSLIHSIDLYASIALAVDRLRWEKPNV